MITYKIRVKSDKTSVLLFKFGNVFTGLDLSLSPSSYILVGLPKI